MRTTGIQQTNRIQHTSVILFAATILTAAALSAPASAQGKPDKSAVAPELVRLSLVQGDVRITRGPKAAKAAGSAWEHATVNLPLASGFSLTTGNGRAEIEFEDASTLYLAPHSALTFNDLTAFNSVPSSTMTLLTGTATLNARTTIPGEHFLIETPVGHTAVDYPANAIERIDSYLDAMAITTYKIPRPDPQSLNFPSHAVPLTVIYRKGARPIHDPEQENPTFLAWDGWVAARMGERQLAMDNVMHQASLNVPLPGLTDMAGQGSFFPCEPYGTCWEPTAGWQTSADRDTPDHNATPQAVTPRAAATTAYSMLNQHWEDVGDFPCSPFALHQLVSIDPLTHKSRILRTELTGNDDPWSWTVCHTGSWIRYRRHYVWVVGRHRHHHFPVRWVKANGRTGFVPIHPRDEKGKPPVNLKEGLYTVDHKHNAELTAYKQGTPLELLAEAPRFTRQTELPLLAKADPPQLLAQRDDHVPATRRTTAASAGIPATATLTFDAHKQSFMISQTSAARPGVSITEPFGGRIDHPNYTSNSFRQNVAEQRTFESQQGRSDFSSGAHAGTTSFSPSSGGSLHGSSGGSFSGGGGSAGGGGSYHGGGGSFSGGGGGSAGGGSYHGGGGSSGGSASTSSAASSSSSGGGGGGASAGSGAGGAHH